MHDGVRSCARRTGRNGVMIVVCVVLIDVFVAAVGHARAAERVVVGTTDG